MRGYDLGGGEWLEMLQDVYRMGKDLQVLNGDIVTQYARWRKHGNPKDSTAVDLNGGSTLEGRTRRHAPIFSSSKAFSRCSISLLRS